MTTEQTSRTFRILGAGVLAMGMAMPLPAAADWSSYRRHAEANNVVLSFKYKHRRDCTDVKWKAENWSNNRAWPSVVDKQYTCAGGGVERRSDETVGSSNLAPGSSATTISDGCICKGRGGVSNVRGNLRVRTP